jgi:hypothetical protein
MHNQHDTETASMIHQRVCERAYELWEQRGCPEGSPDEDWYMAEREIEGAKAGESDTNPEEQFLYTAAV